LWGFFSRNAQDRHAFTWAKALARHSVGSTFLHEDKHVPPDETLERDAPPCPNCQKQMSLVRVDIKLSDAGTESRREYECIRCGKSARLI
jgi:hypothetical protein